MSYRDGSWRSRPLPAGWGAIRRRVLERDGGVCQWIDDSGWCGLPANQVDHIDRHGDDGLANLQALCEVHHARKSASEGGVAAAESRREIWRRLRKPPERHPGMP